MHGGVSVGAYVMAVGLSNDSVNGLTGLVIRTQGERVVVELPEPFKESALKVENIRVVPARVGVWEKVLSNSTSPGDFYWYNWDSGDSVWELPEDVREAVLTDNIEDEGADQERAESTASSSRKRSVSEANLTDEAGSEPEGEDQAGGNKVDELLLLKNRLAELESAKKRKAQQHQQQITALRKEVDMKLSYLEPSPEHGLRVLPRNTVPVAD